MTVKDLVKFLDKGGEKMTVKELITNLKKLPQDLEIVYSIDSEGNAYEKVHFEPVAGHFSGPDFISAAEDRTKVINAVCIN